MGIEVIQVNENKNIRVVILARGFGTRLAEETDIIPKPMVEIGGKAFLCCTKTLSSPSCHSPRGSSKSNKGGGDKNRNDVFGQGNFYIYQIKSNLTCQV
jgi:hypothetical protein